LHSVTGALLAVCRRSLAVAGRLRAMLCGLHAGVSGAPALLGGAHDDVSGADRKRVVVLAIDITLRDRQIARCGSLISCQRRQIASLGARVALAGARKAGRCGLLALERRAATDVTAGLVLAGIGAMREIAIAGRLIAIGGGLVAVRACLVSLTARLIAIGQRLVAIGKRLLAVGERALVHKPPGWKDALVM
jgi:hypothetical protein